MGELLGKVPVFGARGVKIGFCPVGGDTQRVAGLSNAVMRALPLLIFGPMSSADGRQRKGIIFFRLAKAAALVTQ